MHNQLKQLLKLWNDQFIVQDIVLLKISIESIDFYFQLNFLILFLFFSKILQNVEYEILKDWFDMLTSNDACHLDLISMLIL